MYIPLFIFLAWRLLVYIFTAVAIVLLPFQPAFTFTVKYSHRLPYLAWIYGNFDGMIYISIAQDKYHDLQNAFFPLYPLIVHNLHKISGQPIIIDAQIVSCLSFLISLYLIAKIVKLDNFQPLTDLLFMIIILFPTSVYYASAYNDSLFFLLATLCLYLGRRKNFGLASLVGALATLARLNGLALFFFLLTEYFLDKKNVNQIFDKKLKTNLIKKLSPKLLLKSQLYFILLIPLAFLIYLIYTQLAFGDWELVFKNMRIWHQDKMVLPPQVVWRYFKIIFLHPQMNLTYFVAAVEAFFVSIYTFFLIWSFKKIRASYWIFFFLSILIPSLTGTFQGMPRYGLHVYPYFLAIALFLSNKHKLIKILYFVVSLALMLFVITLFTRGYFIS